MRIFAPFIPYVAVLLGIYLLENAWVAAVGYHLGAAAVLLLAWRPKGRKLPRCSPLLVGANAVIGVGTGVVLWALWPLLGMPENLGARFASLGIGSWFWFGLYYCTVNPLLEELFWRRYLSTPRSDILFAGYHMLVLALFVRWEWLLPAFALLALASHLWRRTAGTYGGVRLAAASHLLADVGIVLMAWKYS
ncbi:MAG: hypothetical protein ACYC08_07055 [Armatimonadota bacterium]